jgi:glycosyltransferase involved in cell wall biosynthesis
MHRVLALVQKPVGINPGQRFRLEQWVPYLRSKHGIEITFCAFESDELSKALSRPGNVPRKVAYVLRDFWQRRRAVRDARNYDLAVLYREASLIGPAIYERVLARAGIPFLLDFDDAIWMGSPAGAGKNGVFARLKFPAKTATIARLASAVTVGNEFLADWSRQHNPNVHVVPTSIELAKYPVQPERTGDEPFVIGWMGSFSTLRYLETLRNAIARFGKTRRTELLVVCDHPLEPAIEGVPTRFLRWHADKEAEHIGMMDVGVMPSAYEPFALGKCGCKALQYMAAGRPCVIAPVGVNVDIVKHGENGFLASTDDEWVQAFEKLAASRELRAAFAVAGRKTVVDRFSAEASANAFAAAVHSVIERRRMSNAGARDAGGEPGSFGPAHS